MKQAKWRACFLVASAMLSGFCVVHADNTNRTSMDGLIVERTRPSHTAKPSFGEPGIVKEWIVKPDDVVKKGQVLGHEDTDLEVCQLKTMQAEAESAAPIDAARAKRDAAKIEFTQKSEADQGGGGNASEVRAAKLALDEAEAELSFQKTEHAKKLAEVELQKRKIAKMELLSPVDGTVEKINTQEGEVVDPNKPDGAITLVTNNPLWVEMQVPSAQALKLKQGQKITVAYAMDPGNWQQATVVYMNPEVDAASDSQMVRMELPNDDNKPAGLWLNIRLTGDALAHQASAAQ